MMKKLTFRLRRGILVTFAGLLALALTAGVVWASHSWGPPYHWARTSNPFTLKLGDNVSAAWDAYLAEASSDWSTSSVLDTQIVTGGTRPKNCRPTSGRVEVCSASYGNTGWLGIAQIWITGGEHISQGVVKVNDYYYKSPTYNTPAWRRFVMCQEIGHQFGLDHQDEIFSNPNLGSCMDYTNDPDGPPSNEHPNAHDLAQLEAIYGHLDSFTTLGAAAPQKFWSRLAGAIEPPEWGSVVRRSADGRPSLFEYNLGAGRKILTYVIWEQ